MVTEQRLFPSTKAMECNRYWNWNIYSDHTNLNFADEIARSVTISSKDSDTVPIGVIVDQINRSFIGVNPDRGKHRTEDLIFVDFHLWSDLVKQATSDEETIFVTRYLEASSINE